MGLASGPFPSGFPTKPCIRLSSPPYVDAVTMIYKICEVSQPPDHTLQSHGTVNDKFVPLEAMKAYWGM